MPHYTLQVANMRKAQSFILYPYKGGNDIQLQSEKRFIQANLRTGEAYINGQNCNYANSLSLYLNPVKFQLPEDIKIKIQGYLWHNEAKREILAGCYFLNKANYFHDN